ncbi:sulfurtransferase TusA family protein [Parapedomonas caeni]
MPPVPPPPPGAPAGDGAGVRVDARGLRCPMPVLRLRRAAEGLAAGRRIELLATDPAALSDVPAFCGERGWTLEARDTDAAGLSRFLIRV